jgi:hypothetical protein
VSGDRFLPYGAAVLLSVPLYGAVTSILWAYASPEGQPFAAADKTLSRGACGIFVAQTGDRIWYARVELNERGTARSPQARRGRLSSVARDQLASSAVGPLQPAARAQDQALALREELLRDAGAAEPVVDAVHTCAASPPPVRVKDTPQRRLAELYQPELVVDRRDGFWPVPVRTIFAMEDRRARACRRIDDRDADLCVRLSKQGDLPWSGGDGEWIEYPADNRHDDQHRQMVEALGSIDPARTAREYFLVSGGDSRRAPVTVQYWFFYTYNEQPTKAGSAGRHEGDFESAGVLLSARTHRPRYVWMARHADEGRMFTWSEAAVKRAEGTGGAHFLAFAARGSHATYESCLTQTRTKAPAGIIDDHPTCAPARQLHLAPESTPLTDLSRVGWGCWRGLFGHRPGGGVFEQIPYLQADAPRSPLWQQRFGDERAEPCRGVEDPGPRDGLGEEVLPQATSKALRAAAGRLDPLVDDCRDWEHPPPTGTYLVACSPEGLSRYVQSGLEDPGPEGLHIDEAGVFGPTRGPVDVPAVRRDPVGRRMDTWRIAATARTKVAVYASCRHGGGLLEARFRAVDVEADEPLRLDDRRRSSWRLRRDDGTTAATAGAHVVRGKVNAGERACG